MKHGQARIGTSGYQYDHWRGELYPRDLPKRRWLACYAERFDTVEINNTFYKLPKPEVFDAWAAEVPRHFRFALKFSRYGTHIKKLKDPAEPIDRFMEHAHRLGKKLGPILVQLPPRFRLNVERLDTFLSHAPRRQRWVVELRDPSWLCDPVFEVLRSHGAALCIHDLLADHPRIQTAPFAYYRFHGTGHDYGGRYSAQRLAAEARKLRPALRAGTDVYAYFNNDHHGDAVVNAEMLRRYVEAPTRR